MCIAPQSQSQTEEKRLVFWSPWASRVIAHQLPEGRVCHLSGNAASIHSSGAVCQRSWLEPLSVTPVYMHGATGRGVAGPRKALSQQAHLLAIQSKTVLLQEGEAGLMGTFVAWLAHVSLLDGVLTAPASEACPFVDNARASQLPTRPHPPPLTRLGSFHRDPPLH